VVSFAKQLGWFRGKSPTERGLVLLQCLTQTASMRQEIDCKMPSNYSWALTTQVEPLCHLYNLLLYFHGVDPRTNSAAAVKEAADQAIPS
jgi:hypothetical protein